MSQLSLLAPPPEVSSSDLPLAVMDVIHAARAFVFQASVVRGVWGIGIGQKRKWALTGDCCCALSALIVFRGAIAEARETSPIHAGARLLGVTEREAYAFLDGFDHGHEGSKWAWYGKRVAEELGV